jgi:hypothetical protein
MNMRAIRLAFPAVAFVLCLLIVGCSGNKVTKANYDKIKKDMTEAQVKEVLGSPTETQNQGKTQIWKNGDEFITVMFNDGKVIGTGSSYDVKK